MLVTSVSEQSVDTIYTTIVVLNILLWTGTLQLIISATMELSISMSNFSFVLRGTGHACFLLSANNEFYRELNELKQTV